MYRHTTCKQKIRQQKLFKNQKRYDFFFLFYSLKKKKTKNSKTGISFGNFLWITNFVCGFFMCVCVVAMDEWNGMEWQGQSKKKNKNKTKTNKNERK